MTISELLEETVPNRPVILTARHYSSSISLKDEVVAYLDLRAAIVVVTRKKKAFWITADYPYNKWTNATGLQRGSSASNYTANELSFDAACDYLAQYGTVVPEIKDPKGEYLGTLEGHYQHTWENGRLYGSVHKRIFDSYDVYEKKNRYALYRNKNSRTVKHPLSKILLGNNLSLPEDVYKKIVANKVMLEL